MSKQYMKQMNAVEDGYQSAYFALKDYSTGWRTLFNPKRWAIRQALKKVNQYSSASVVMNTLFESIPSVSTINPASKLGALFYVIHKKEGSVGLHEATTASIKNIVSLSDKNIVKLLRRYSAWGIVRLFTGELGNKHVKEVRNLLKQWDANELTTDALIQQISALDIKQGDPLGELVPLITAQENNNVEDDHQDYDSHSLSKDPIKNPVQERQLEEDRSGYDPRFTFTQRSARKEQVLPTRVPTILNEIEEAEIKQQKMKLAQNVANLALALESINQLLDNPCQLLGITEEERLAKKQIVNVLLERFKQVDVKSINNLSINDVRETAKNIATLEKERQDLHSNIDSKKASDQSKPILNKIEEDLKRSEERFGKELDSLTSDDPEYLKEVELLKQEMARARVQFLQTVEPVASQHTSVVQMLSM